MKREVWTKVDEIMKRIVTGILAHVDAGKTTLSEGLLYKSGAIRKAGRVDHKDTVLDGDEQERARGITIFSKQANIEVNGTQITLLDTPGHVDFAAEMERTLRVLDYAILVISGTDGVQSHTRTLWKLLMRYEIPVFLFVNKMDMPGVNREMILQELQQKLHPHMVSFDSDFMETEEFAEQIAVSDEKLLAEYLETGELKKSVIPQLILNRNIFPVYFGSALRMEGVEEFLAGFEAYTIMNEYSDSFGARVYKITRDEQGNRLTHMKITGGKLCVRDELRGIHSIGEEQEEWAEKINQIRVYQGGKFEAISEAESGMVCAVTGLSYTYPGQGFGTEEDCAAPILQPVLTYQVLLQDGTDPAKAFLQLKTLEEEEPQLELEWSEETGEILAKLMGEVQIEVLGKRIASRLGMDVRFGPGSIVYRETIEDIVEGVGHYEPLRHYAEVHLVLEPGEVGSGMVFETDCSEENLAKNWQRLILTHLREKEYVGVLTGSAITDIKIKVVAGKAHLKHTEGGDFRQATYRAVRHGLMKAKSKLLEPFYEFFLEIPADQIGRALTDLERMGANFNAPEIEGDMSIVHGKAPVSTMQGYQMEVLAYTKGKGSLACEFFGYLPCHNSEEVIATRGYVPELDVRNPAGSVFCAHGAGFYVDWSEVENYMHVENVLGEKKKKDLEEIPVVPRYESATHARYADISYSDDKELQQIFTRTFGEKKDKSFATPKVYNYNKTPVYKPVEKKKEYFLVDGYNVIHAWENLHELSVDNLEAARDALADILCNYQGYRGCHVILVFDAYKVKGNVGEVVRYHNIDIVYTKEAQTADQYIEKAAHEIGHKYQVTVVTSDGLEQVIIRGAGCALMSSREFKEEASRVDFEIHQSIDRKVPGNQKNYAFEKIHDIYGTEE